jgi:hypothetical protein
MSGFGNSSRPFSTKSLQDSETKHRSSSLASMLGSKIPTPYTLISVRSCSSRECWSKPPLTGGEPHSQAGSPCASSNDVWMRSTRSWTVRSEANLDSCKGTGKVSSSLIARSTQSRLSRSRSSTRCAAELTSAGSSPIHAMVSRISSRTRCLLIGRSLGVSTLVLHRADRAIAERYSIGLRATNGISPSMGLQISL